MWQPPTLGAWLSLQSQGLRQPRGRLAGLRVPTLLSREGDRSPRQQEIGTWESQDCGSEPGSGGKGRGPIPLHCSGAGASPCCPPDARPRTALISPTLDRPRHSLPFQQRAQTLRGCPHQTFLRVRLDRPRLPSITPSPGLGLTPGTVKTDPAANHRWGSATGPARILSVTAAALWFFLIHARLLFPGKLPPWLRQLCSSQRQAHSTAQIHAWGRLLNRGLAQTCARHQGPPESPRSAGPGPLPLLGQCTQETNQAGQ